MNKHSTIKYFFLVFIVFAALASPRLVSAEDNTAQDNKNTIKKNTGIKVENGINGFQRITDYDKGTVTIKINGEVVEPIVDPIIPCDCDESQSELSSDLINKIYSLFAVMTNHMYDTYTLKFFYKIIPNPYKDQHTILIHINKITN